MNLRGKDSYSLLSGREEETRGWDTTPKERKRNGHNKKGASREKGGGRGEIQHGEENVLSRCGLSISQKKGKRGESTPETEERGGVIVMPGRRRGTAQKG